MTTDTTLIEKREELKRRLAAGEYKTLVDIFLERVDRLLRKITRRSKPLPIWLITVMLSFVMILISLGANYIAGDLASLRIVEFYGLGYGLGILVLILSFIFIIATVIVINQSIGRVVALWRDNLLDATESVASLQEFEDWLEKACNWRLHFVVTIFGGLLGSLYVASISSTLLGRFVGYGSVFGIFIGNMFVAAFLYLFLIVILLPIILRRYDLKLFAADPGTSEPIARLSGELGFFVSFVAVFAAILTLLNASMGILQETAIGVLFLWAPIIIMFMLNQTSLASMIRRAKWKTLNEIQIRIEKLQAAENFEDKETMDAINRLLDYHERVNKTRNSAIDFGTALNFINSLLLPLLAFLLGNLDLVLSLFKKQP